MRGRRIIAALAGAGALALAAPAGAGATLVYVKGANSLRPSVHAAADDGSGARRLATGSFPSLSPDGAQVAYANAKAPDFTQDLYLVPAAGGTPRRIVRDSEPFSLAWSPDSTRLAVAVGRRRLVLVDVATGATRTIARGYVQGISFSPDGARLAYGRARSDSINASSDVYAAELATGAITRLTGNGRSHSPRWGPSAIAFTRERRVRGDAPKFQLWTMAPDGSRERRLTRVRVGFLLSGLTATEWSADGTRLLAEFVGQDTSEAWAVNPASGRARDVTGRFDGVIGFALSHDGRTILGATRGFDPGDRHDVVTVRYAGGRPRVLVRNAFYADWNR